MQPKDSSGSTDIVPSTDPKQALIHSIRSWIHMDNLLENHNAQASNARSLRSKHERDAIQLMKQMRLEKSTIKVSGAALMIQKKTTPSALTWGYLQREITAWATRSGISATQAQSLLEWLHSHRDERESEMLKKLS